MSNYPIIGPLKGGELGPLVRGAEYHRTKNVVRALSAINFDDRYFETSYMDCGIDVGLNFTPYQPPIKSFAIHGTSTDSVKVYGGSVRYHGKYIATMADTTIKIIGGTLTWPMYVYVEMPWASKVIGLQQAILEPMSNNDALIVPLFTCFLSGTNAKVIKVLYDGDIQIGSPVAG